MVDQNTKWAKCPLPGCGEDLIIWVTLPVYVTDESLTTADLRMADLDGGDFETACANGHIIDCGGAESDGRTVRLGHRKAQSLSGLR